MWSKFLRGAEVLAKKDMKAYMDEVLLKDRVLEYLDENNIHLTLPSFEVVLSCGPKVAGLTYGKRLIKLSSWVTVDEEETLRVIRHEAAHVVKHVVKLPGSHHGKEYSSALRIVSPELWREDKHWYPNTTIEEARLKIHTTSKSLL